MIDRLIGPTRDLKHVFRTRAEEGERTLTNVADTVLQPVRSRPGKQAVHELRSRAFHSRECRVMLNISLRNARNAATFHDYLFVNHSTKTRIILCTVEKNI